MASKTPISILQELMMCTKHALPDYTFESIGDLLNPQFSCTVKAATITAIAVGRNKKEAKQKAASNALQQLQKSDNVKSSQLGEPDEIIADSKFIALKELPQGYCDGTNYVGMLNEYAPTNSCVVAVKYEDLQNMVNGQFQVNCIFDKKKTFGFARVKKQAKQIAAFEMLQYLKSSDLSSARYLKEFEDADEIDGKAITEFQKLTSSKSITRKNTNVEPLPGLKQQEHLSLEEAIKKLSELNLNYHVETLQKNPIAVVAVELKESLITGMGKGETEHIATTNAMNRVLSSLSQGCSFLN